MLLTNLDIKVLRELDNDENLIRQAFANPLYFSKLLIEDDGKVIGASLVRLTSEITIIFDKDSNNIQRIKALKILLDEQVRIGKGIGIDQVHAFTDIDKDLMLHLGFKERNEKPYILHF